MKRRQIAEGDGVCRRGFIIRQERRLGVPIELSVALDLGNHANHIPFDRLCCDIEVSRIRSYDVLCMYGNVVKMPKNSLNICLGLGLDPFS